MEPNRRGLPLRISCHPRTTGIIGPLRHASGKTDPPPASRVAEPDRGWRSRRTPLQRPEGTCRELLDAGATRIRIQIRDGGQSSLKVSDNGFGIPEDQLELAVTRHATSKLENLQDLQDIKSFGFRGEALPSIASVSRFRIASARQDGDGGVLEVLHGRIVRQDKTAMPQGTEIEVSDLFLQRPGPPQISEKTGYRDTQMRRTCGSHRPCQPPCRF